MSEIAFHFFHVFFSSYEKVSEAVWTRVFISLLRNQQWHCGMLRLFPKSSHGIEDKLGILVCLLFFKVDIQKRIM